MIIMFFSGIGEQIRHLHVLPIILPSLVATIVKILVSKYYIDVKWFTLIWIISAGAIFIIGVLYALFRSIFKRRHAQDN